MYSCKGESIVLPEPFHLVEVMTIFSQASNRVSQHLPTPHPRWLGGAIPCVWLVLVMMFAGCGDEEGRIPVYKVTGKVTVSGEVPEGALVVLYPAKIQGDQELRPSGKVRSDGSFSLTTYDADDGAPVGEYTATIEWNKLIKRGQDSVAGPNVIAKDYAKRESSTWKIKVEDTPNELPPLQITK